MTARFLITTADESTWRTDVPVLFVGEWCKRYSRREVWSALDCVTLPYHWDDRGRLFTDYQYLREFHERLLRDLTAQLNEIHRVDHGLRYWRILIGPWLGYFVQMLFDRWTSIQQAVAQHEISETIVLCGDEARLVPNDMSEWAGLFCGDEWNHQIYSAVLRRFTSVPCSTRQRHVSGNVTDAVPARSWQRKLRGTLGDWYANAAGALVRDTDAFLLATYLPAVAQLRVHRCLGQVPQRWKSVPPVEVEFDAGRRQWSVGGECRSEFESCAHALIPQHIPRIYLEGFGRLVEQTNGLPWPSEPKAIFTSNSHNSNDVFKAWAAAKVEQGSPLVIGQHGGHYGTGLWCFLEEHDIAISDRYLSWGWSDTAQPKVKPVGQLKVKEPLRGRRGALPDALLVTASLSRFSYCMYSACVAGQWLDYFNDQCSFVENLPRHIQDALTVRLYAEDFGWDQYARWRDRFPDLRLDRGQVDINNLICRSRLYICTYNATTFLEAFTMNVPAVIYWNERHWELRDSAIPFFDDLKRVGVFHATPQSAARHVAAIWNDVDAWWQSAPVQEVLDRFKKRYSYLPEDLPDRVGAALAESTCGVYDMVAQ